MSFLCLLTGKRKLKRWTNKPSLSKAHSEQTWQHTELFWPSALLAKQGQVLQRSREKKLKYSEHFRNFRAQRRSLKPIKQLEKQVIICPSCSIFSRNVQSYARMLRRWLCPFLDIPNYRGGHEDMVAEQWRWVGHQLWETESSKVGAEWAGPLESTLFSAKKERCQWALAPPQERAEMGPV